MNTIQDVLKKGINKTIEVKMNNLNKKLDSDEHYYANKLGRWGLVLEVASIAAYGTAVLFGVKSVRDAGLKIFTSTATCGALYTLGSAIDYFHNNRNRNRKED
ncbi:MAG: hypothetical protein NTX24_02015 [Candidatus Pacearchaeota archaeon]|nr:hypothetical protein [Candidatus Pacearchaeota archaeon]